jgi:hypothetical protein
MSIPDQYAFAFDEISTADTVQRKFNLDISIHYWFWDMFVFRKNFNRNAGQPLLADYYKAVKLCPSRDHMNGKTGS